MHLLENGACLMSQWNIVKLLNVLLSFLFFVVIIDPTNTLFHLKEGAFIVFAITYLLWKPKIDTDFLLVLLLLFFLFVFSFIYGIVNGFDFLLTETMSFFKTFLFFGVLLFVNNESLPFFYKLYYPCLLVSIITITVYVLAFSFPDFFNFIYTFATNKDDTIIISTRSFLGLDITSIFYKSSPLLIVLLSNSYYCYLHNWKSRKMNLLYSLLFFIALMCSGTRANMFSAILIVCIISGYKIRKVMGRKVHFFLFLILMMGALSLTVKMLSEKEDSVEMKGGHLNSMLELFQKNPSILLLGEGAGSLYYSKGVGENIAISELTYIELIRMYGIFGGGFILLLYFFPVLYLFQIKSEESHAIGWGYLAYLFIGGTNPLLVSSTGIILLAAVYSYIYIKRKIVL